MRVKEKMIFLLAAFLSLAAYPVHSQSEGNPVKTMNFRQLEPLLHQQNDTVYVVNFWATWCAPCIKEVPAFEQIGEKYRGRNVKVIMVSLDMPNQFHTKLVPFMEKYKMKNRVILLDDPRMNLWIPLVDEHWGGAIPATLVYRNGRREFYEREFTFEELDKVVEQFLE